MDVSKASGIRSFMQIPKKDADEKKTDLQKQLIQLSKQDDSLAKMAQQKATAPIPKTVKANTDTAVTDLTQSKGSVSQTDSSTKRFDEFVKQADKPASSPTGIYSLKKGEDGKPKIVSEETDIPKAFLKETAEAAVQETEKSSGENVAKPTAQGKDNEAEETDKKGKEDYGTIAKGKVRFECDDPEHKANPALHNECECEKVAEAPSVRPATAIEAGMA